MSLLKLSGIDEIFFNKASIADTLEFFFYRNNSRQRKSTNDVDGDSFFTFINNSEQFIKLLMKAIKNESFEFMPARKTKVNADKIRDIYKFTWHDKFVLAHLARCIDESVANELSQSVHSFRKGRSSFTAIAEVTNYIKNNPGDLYILRRDIKNFGESLDHSNLIRDFEDKLRPSAALKSLFKKACEFLVEQENGEITKNSKGLPTGSHLQLVMGNLYLSVLDNELDVLKDGKYLRYGDDLLFLTKDPVLHMKARQHMEGFVRDKSLLFNDEKSSDIVLTKPHNIKNLEKQTLLKPQTYFPYLGARIWHSASQSLSREKQRTIQNFIKTRLKQSISNNSFLDPSEKTDLLISTLIELVKKESFLNSNPIRDYLQKLPERSELKNLDLWTAQTIIKLAHGGGFNKALFKKLSFKELRRRGLPALQHLRRINEI